MRAHALSPAYSSQSTTGVMLTVRAPGAGGRTYLGASLSRHPSCPVTAGSALEQSGAKCQHKGAASSRRTLSRAPCDVRQRAPQPPPQAGPEDPDLQSRLLFIGSSLPKPYHPEPQSGHNPINHLSVHPEPITGSGLPKPYHPEPQSRHNPINHLSVHHGPLNPAEVRNLNGGPFRTGRAPLCPWTWGLEGPPRDTRAWEPFTL